MHDHDTHSIVRHVLEHTPAVTVESLTPQERRFFTRQAERAGVDLGTYLQRQETAESVSAEKEAEDVATAARMYG